MAALAMNLLACASKLEGPSPKVTSVAPAQICTAQRAVTIVVSGEGFSPVVADALTSTPRVLMPTVALVSAQTPTPVPAEGVALPAGTHDGRSLSVTIPAMLVGPRSATEASAVYDLSVTNPNGNGNTLAGAITILPPPTLTDVRPVEICSEIMSTLMLTGSNFRPGATVTIATSPTTTLGPLGITVSGDGTMATVTVPAAALANGGPYEVTIINPEAGGCAASRPMALTVEPAPTLTSVMPGTGAGGHHGQPRSGRHDVPARDVGAPGGDARGERQHDDRGQPHQRHRCAGSDRRRRRHLWRHGPERRRLQLHAARRLRGHAAQDHHHQRHRPALRMHLRDHRGHHQGRRLGVDAGGDHAANRDAGRDPGHLPARRLHRLRHADRAGAGRHHAAGQP
ncbi:MAG: IPT/TIG domain-containing protein [Deltaproteobacteria bacterium]|nr:IPT/TIG domain-containing protein [Deltaproteobacteria bacterium]